MDVTTDPLDVVRGSGYRAVADLKNTGVLGEKGDEKKEENFEEKGQLWHASTSWVSTSHKRTLTLGPHWDQLKTCLSEIIKTFADQKVKKQVSREVVFKLLGPDFVRTNYPSMKREPHILEEPYMMGDVREALLKEFKKELLTVVSRHLDKIKFKENPSYGAYERAVTQSYDKQLGMEVALMAKAASIKAAQDTFVNVAIKDATEADRERVATGVANAVKHATEEGRGELLGQGLIALLLGNGFEIGSEGIEHHVQVYGEDSPLEKSKTSNSKSAKTHPADLLEYDDGAELVLDPGTWSKKMDHNSRTLLRALIGRCIPVSLRRFVFKWRLFDADDVETTHNVMRRNVAIQRLKDATESALYTMICRTVPISFNADLREYDSKDMRTAAILILNQYFVTYGTQHASHIDLLVPLLVAFPRQPLRGPVLVSMFNRLLHILPGNGPARSGALHVARLCVEGLKRDDQELHEFLVGLLDKARAQQNELRSMNLTYRDLGEFREIASFLVPWIDTCLVGFLKRNAAEFVWDQCFLCGWEKQFPLFVIDVMRASKKDIMTTKSAYELQRVMHLAGRNVTTKALRKLYRARVKDKSEANVNLRPRLDNFFDVPVLTRLHDAQPESTSVKRIQRLLAMVGGASEVRRQREDEEAGQAQRALECLANAIEACVSGDELTLSSLLMDKQVTSDSLSKKSQSLLYIAAFNGRPKCVQALLEYKAPVEVGDHTVGLTPLHGALLGSNSRLHHGVKNVSERYRFVVKYLLDAGADPNHPCVRTVIRPREMISADEYDKLEKDHSATLGKLSLCGPLSTPMHVSVACASLRGTRYYGSPALILLMRRYGGDSNKPNGDQETSASLAIENKAPLAVKYALESSIVEDKDVNFINTLREACAINSESTFAKVMGQAKKSDTRNFRVVLNGVGGLEGGTASKEMPQLAEWEVAGASPLSLACEKGATKLVRALLDAGADVDCGRPGPFTPLMSACRTLGPAGDPKNPPVIDLIKRLVKAGATGEARSAETGETALHFVAKQGIEVLYDHLVKQSGAKGSTPDLRGHTPRSLLSQATGKASADINATDFDVPDFSEGTGKVEKKAIEEEPSSPMDKISVSVSEKVSLDLVVPHRIPKFDELVETCDLVLDHPENIANLDKLSIEAVKLSKTGAAGAKELVEEAIAKSLIEKYKSIVDNRGASFMKAKVKNNDGRPVLVKIRQLENTDSGMEAALERANIVVERLNLPSTAAAKLAKALLTYSQKKGKAQKNLNKMALGQIMLEESDTRSVVGKFINVTFAEKSLELILDVPKSGDRKGAQVVSLAEKGVADKGGVMAGDLVDKIGNHSVRRRELSDIEKIIRSEKRPVIIRFLRPGNEFDIEIQEGENSGFKLGQNPRSIKPELVVLNVEENSAASRGMVQTNDRIISVASKDMRDMKYDSVVAAIQDAPRPAIVRLVRPVDKETARLARETAASQKAVTLYKKKDLGPPPALSAKPGKTERDVKFKKDKTLDMHFFKNPLGGGVVVSEVKRKGNAEKNKILVGDVVVGVDGKDVSKHPENVAKEMLKSEKRPLIIRFLRPPRVSKRPKGNEHDTTLKHPISDSFEWVRPPHGGGAAISEIKAVGTAEKLKVSVGDTLVGISGIDLTSMPFVETAALIESISPPVVVRFRRPIKLSKKPLDGEVDVKFKKAVVGLVLDHPMMGEGTVVFVVDKGSEGDEAGLVPGDRLIGINGLDIRDEPLKIAKKMVQSAKPPVTLRFLHTTLKNLPRRPRKTEVDIVFESGPLGFGLKVDADHHIECAVADVVSGSAAEKAGVQIGYYIVGVDGKDVRASPYEEALRLLNMAERPVSIRFHTKPKTANVKVVLDAIKEKMRDENLSAADVFREIDTDGGGTVSPDEFRQGIALFGFASTDPEFRALMDVLDANGDGEIELDEFEEALANPEMAAMIADEELAAAASSLQAIARGRSERAEFIDKKEKAIKIQALARGKSDRKKVAKQKRSATKIQAQIRGKQTRKRVLGRNKSKKTVDEPDTARTDDTVNLLTARTDDSVLTKQSGERAVSPVENAEDGIEHL